MLIGGQAVTVLDGELRWREHLFAAHTLADELGCYPTTVDEKVDVLDARGKQTGEVAWKSEVHRLGLWHRCFHCWIAAPETPSGGPYLFVQRRALEKETWPDRLDVTVGGHLGAGEEALDGLREVEEELGLAVLADELIPLGTRRAELEIPAGLDREQPASPATFWPAKASIPLSRTSPPRTRPPAGRRAVPATRPPGHL